MKKNCFWILILLAVFVSCTKSEGYKEKMDVPYQKMEPQRLEIVEFNKALFALDTANFEEEYRAILPQFQAILIENPDEEEIGYMKDFVTDTFMVKINELVNETFPNITPVTNGVKGVYQHYKYYYPDFVVPPTFTYVSGIYSNRPDVVSEESVMIGLDFYLSNKDLVYDKLGYSRYQSRRMQPFSLMRDLAEEFYYTTYGNRVNQKNVLAEMVEQGKRYYFIEAMDPSLPDSVILGYSSQQMAWAEDNEGMVWAAIVGNNMLYNNVLDQKRMLFNDGPFTAAFDNNAPARLGDFIGLQIVRSFMSNNDEDFVDLMQMTDYQDILQRSQYKPRK
ncbi:MAG: hypothetical protein J6X10_03565 [Bacteroidales bacterium]|nr:hypothetical protein [Bacteroidales bacterium]